MKFCSGCSKDKDLEDFANNRSTRDGKQSWCRECVRKYNPGRRDVARVRRASGFCKSHPSISTDGKSRCQICMWNEEESRLKSTYGIDLETYAWMEYGQGRLCATCLKPDTRSLCVDHNHSTGKVRSLLCTRCNLLVGNCGEKLDILASLIKYLETHSERN